MRILTKPWMGKENGRLVVVKHNKVVFSVHYRNAAHREQLIKEINLVIVLEA